MDSSSFLCTFEEAKLEPVNVLNRCGQKVCAMVALLASQSSPEDKSVLPTLEKICMIN